jgi:2-polyprenyl-3-methyl-5-hydroxy-6-metoxy-1,4-benzoquinol methylase
MQEPSFSSSASGSGTAPSASTGARCLACGSADAATWATARDVEYVTSPDTFQYLHCQGCGVLFIDPVPRARLAEIYPSNYYSFAPGNGGIAVRVKEWLDGRMFRKLLRKLPDRELAVLDVGGGAGRQLDVVRRVDARVRDTQIVDLDPEAAALATASGHQFHCGRIEDFTSSRTFDLVLMLNLIEHVADPAGVLSRMRELLSPGGILLLKTPNWDAWDARLFRHASWAGYHCPRHWVLFTRPSLTAMVERAGLKVASFAYTQGAPSGRPAPWPGWPPGDARGSRATGQWCTTPRSGS